MKSSIAAVFLTSLAAATHSQGKEVSFYTIIRNDHPKAPMQNKENTKTLLSHFLLRCISKRSNPTFASCKILGPLISEEMDASIITPTIRIGSHSSTKTITMFKLLWGFHSPLVTRPLPMSWSIPMATFILIIINRQCGIMRLMDLFSHPTSLLHPFKPMSTMRFQVTFDTSLSMEANLWLFGKKSLAISEVLMLWIPLKSSSLRMALGTPRFAFVMTRWNGQSTETLPACLEKWVSALELARAFCWESFHTQTRPGTVLAAWTMVLDTCLASRSVSIPTLWIR